MKKDYTDINLILDRSGSMESMRDETIGSINRFIQEQQTVPGEATFSLYQFDDVFENPINNVKLSDVPPLTRDTFVPRGMTALHDAIGKSINIIGNRLSLLCEEDRPDKVFVAIVTDGLENASSGYTGPKVAEMTKHQQDHYSWEFVYLGANQDAIHVAKTFNISASNSMNFTSASGAFCQTSAFLTSYRSTGKGSF